MEVGAVLVFFLSVIAVNSACAPAGEECLLPNCQCPGVTIPSDLPPDQIPQIVYVTFDDAINVINYPLYEEILFQRKNPDGQPITATFYITHEYTDYNKTHQLWRHGHEIALHTITHQTNNEYWKDLSPEGWRRELLDQREMMAHFAKIPAKDMTGMRAPFLQTGGDLMMEGIYKELQYDCSRPTLAFIDPGLWPYTMDYDTEFQDCEIEPCATGKYPGFWNLPMVDHIGDDGNPCSMLDQCLPNPDTPEKVVSLLKRNFLRSYEGNRSPFGIFLHAAWLLPHFPGHRQGFEDFLDYLGTLPDVYIVSSQRALEWFRHPTRLSEIANFEPWKVTINENACRPALNCRFGPNDTPFGSERYMMSCQKCPKKYPWLGNPLGDV